MTVTEGQSLAAPPVDPLVQNLMSAISPPQEMSPYLRLFLYGDMGSGKTTLAAGAPRNLMVDADKGQTSIFNHPEYLNNFQRFNFNSFAQVEMLAAKCREGHFAAYQTITLDKITDIAHTGIREISEAAAQMSGRNPNVFDTDDRVENNERIRALMENFRRLDKNLIVLSSAKTVENRDKIMTTMPEFSERLVGTLGGMFDIVGYMYREDDGMGNVQIMMRVMGTTSIIARSRIGELPPVIINPTWDGLYGAYMAMRERASAALKQE